MATPQGRRAFALLQVGEKRLAEAELRSLWVDTAQDGAFDRSDRCWPPGRWASPSWRRRSRTAGGVPRPNAPVPTRLQPADGFVVDPPLVYALVRHEFELSCRGGVAAQAPAA